MAFVRAAGYEFTPQEIAMLSGEMTNEELDGVAGGQSTACHKNKTFGQIGNLRYRRQKNGLVFTLFKTGIKPQNI